MIKAPHIFNEPSALCAGDMVSKHRNRLYISGLGAGGVIKAPQNFNEPASGVW